MAKKYDDKVTDATDATTTDDSDPRELTGLAVDEDATGAALVPVRDAADLARLMRGMTMAPKVIKLTKGTAVEGDLIGAGEIVINSKHSGEPEPKRSWILELRGGLRVEFLGAHELDRCLTPLMGAVADGRRIRVVIARGDDERAGSNVVTRYLVGHEDLGARK